MHSKCERGLKQLANGKWQYMYTDENGVYVRRQADTKSQARARRDAGLSEVHQVKYLGKKRSSNKRFPEMVVEFLAWSQKNRRPSTYRNDQIYSRFWLRNPAFANRRLDDITPAHVRAYQGHRKEMASEKTADNDLARLKRLFSIAEKMGYCRSNPVKEVPLYNPESCRHRFLSEEEEERLLAVCPDYIRPIVILAIHTGLRQGNLMALTRRQINLASGHHGEITVTAASAKGKKTFFVPLDATARALLDDLLVGLRPNDLVFTLFKGKFGSRLRSVWEKAVKAAGLYEVDKKDRVVWHTLRHTFASRLVMRGVALKTVQDLFSHASMAMTLRYAHLAPGHLADAVLVLDAKLQNTDNEPQRQAEAKTA